MSYAMVKALRLIVLLMFIMSICLFSLPSCYLPTQPRVLEVIDGDTVIVSDGYRIRYIGIDTPERGEPYYEQATALNRHLVEGKRVTLERDVSDEDRYGRKLRYVYAGDIFVNAELVRLGLAIAVSYPPDIGHQPLFEQMEFEAIAEKRGIWGNMP